MSNKGQLKAAGTEKVASQQSASQQSESPSPSDPDPKIQSAEMTPMMAQYIEIKTANPDCLLFYRMGDFYELFFEDAEISSRAVGIQLTKRGKLLGKDVPMCGVPVHTADEYLQRLIRLGHRVAVCEQLEDPAEAKKRGSKSVVRRGVVRLVTPGTLTEESLLDAARNNYLTSLFQLPGNASAKVTEYTLATVDISTGEFLISAVTENNLSGELVRLRPSEVIVSDNLMSHEKINQAVELSQTALTPVPGPYFDSSAGERDLKTVLGVAALEGFGEFSRGELSAIAAVLKYIEITQIGHRPSIRPPQRFGTSTILTIDAATRNNLEITNTIKGEKKGSLLSAIDCTVTGAGARELVSRLSSPLTDPETIIRRLDVVGFFIEEEDIRERLRAELKIAPDIARALSRICLNRGGPRDLGAIRSGLQISKNCLEILEEKTGVLANPELLESIMTRFRADCSSLARNLNEALNDDLPILKRDGGFIRNGFDDDLDENRLLRDESRKIIAALQGKYASETGVKSLKVRHNNVLGYFVEVTALNAATMTEPPHDTFFIHRQTLASAVRFTTTELGETESKITTAGERALRIEQEIFSSLCSQTSAIEKEIASIATALAEMDHYCALATLAENESYTRPKIDESQAFRIIGGRHPVVEKALKSGEEGPFIENDCILGNEPRRRKTGDGLEDSERIWIVTGPNMAGKSTFLRQNALITILAQMGSYVPAQSAHIGVVDRLFSRVGASDDLARGRSTFMVEMVETAGILNQATERSLVILDEIGRGTATFDGLSIAWATVEYLHSVTRCRALFATHYHELTGLVSKLDHASNATIDVKEWKDEIVFLHKVIPGSADRSYGIQVAKLAGLPQTVIARAGEVLNVLESSKNETATENLIDDLPLFAVSRPKGYAGGNKIKSPVEEAMRNINPDELSPKQALEEIYRLKDLSRNSSFDDD